MNPPPEIEDKRIVQFVDITCRNRQGRKWHLYRADDQRGQYVRIQENIDDDIAVDYDVTHGPSYKYRAAFVEDDTEKSQGQAAYTKGTDAGALLPFPPSAASGFFDIEEITELWLLESGSWDDSRFWRDNENWNDGV